VTPFSVTSLNLMVSISWVNPGRTLTGQLANKPTHSQSSRRLVNSWTEQAVDWTIHGLVDSPKYLMKIFQVTNRLNVIFKTSLSAS